MGICTLCFFGVLIVQNVTIFYLPCHPPPYDTELSDLRDFTMRFLGQKAQELAAERHYSLVANVQANKCGSTQPKSAEKRCLFRAEVLQEIAEYAGNVTNDRLKTANEAVAVDEAEMATPGALDQVKLSLFGVIS